MRRSGALARQSVDRLTAIVQLPVAAVRGLVSWYADLHTESEAIRVCRGTSCMLAGAPEVSRAIAQYHKCRHVYCVGYCDRSPALLLPDERVAVRISPVECESWLPARGAPPPDSARVPHLPPTDIRSAARQPIVTGRLLCGDCSELSAARAAGVYASLGPALLASPEQVLSAVEQAGIRGRGGAGFPTGRKWRTCARTSADRKYIIANGDEGDPGSFIDRELMERDPHTILEGMILAAHAVGAREGIVFIRSEYPHAIRIMQRAIEQARQAGLLGPANGDRPFTFDVRVVTGLGSYVCGEETAMLNAIEGRRGEVRPRPPYPAEQGLYGRPTLVDNVETLVNIPWIVRHGPTAYRAMGTAACPGTKALCLNHGFAQPGIVEIEFGVSLRHVIEHLAGGPAAGRGLDAVLLGGPMGSLVLPRDWDVPVCLDAMSKRGVRLGHGGLVALPHGTDYVALLRHMLEFMADESCGKCVPCRIGTQRACEVVERGGLTADAAPMLAQIFELMERASLCGFGRETPGPVRQLIESFGPHISKTTTP